MDKETIQKLVDKGLSQRKMADILGTSQTNMRYWLYKFDLKTNYKKHKTSGARYEELECKHHGLTTFIYEPSKRGYRCKKCRSGKVSQDRRNMKLEAVEFLGGCCNKCGYNKSVWSLHFHHKDKETKDIEIALIIRDRNKKKMFEELAKCELVCANCHGEIEEKEWELGVSGSSRLREEQKE